MTEDEKVAQQQRALDRANEIRIACANYKKELRAMHPEDALHAIAALLRSPEATVPPLSTLTVEQLIGAVHRVGLSKARRMCIPVRCRTNIRLSRLSATQRLVLSAEVQRTAERMGTNRDARERQAA